MEPHQGRREADRAFTHPGDTTFSFQLAKSRHNTVPVCPSNWRNGHVITAGIRMHKKCRGRMEFGLDRSSALHRTQSLSESPRSCPGLLCVPENKAKLTRDGPNVASASSNLVSRAQFYMKELDSPGTRGSLGIIAEKCSRELQESPCLSHTPGNSQFSLSLTFSWSSRLI